MGWRGRHTFTSGKIRCDRRSHEGRPHRDFSATQGPTDCFVRCRVPSARRLVAGRIALKVDCAHSVFTLCKTCMRRTATECRAEYRSMACAEVSTKTHEGTS